MVQQTGEGGDRAAMTRRKFKVGKWARGVFLQASLQITCHVPPVCPVQSTELEPTWVSLTGGRDIAQEHQH